MVDTKKLPEYEAPEVLTFSNEELLEELGPAQTLYNQGPGLPTSW